MPGFREDITAAFDHIAQPFRLSCVKDSLYFLSGNRSRYIDKRTIDIKCRITAASGENDSNGFDRKSPQGGSLCISVFVGKRNLSVISRSDLSRCTIRKCHAINTTFASLVVRLLASSLPLFRYVVYCSNVRVTKQWFINPFSSQAYIIRAIFLASITRAQFSLSFRYHQNIYYTCNFLIIITKVCCVLG